MRAGNVAAHSKRLVDMRGGKNGHAPLRNERMADKDAAPGKDDALSRSGVLKISGRFART